MTTQTEALTLALEALEQMYTRNYKRNALEAITAIREALAQPEQEPVARSDAYDMIDRFLQNSLNSDADYAEYSKALDSLYTTPPQRNPLTITEESAWDLARYVYSRSNPHESPQILLSAMEIKQIIEAAHGITASEAEDSARSKT